MPVPDFQSIMLPLLNLTADEKDHSLREAVTALAEEFRLTPDELAEMLPNGRKTRFYDRVGWAGTYLKKAGLLSASERGTFRITRRGIDVLKSKPRGINVKFLEQFPEFIEFHTRRNKDPKETIEIDTESQTPEEVMEEAYQTWRKSLADEVLEKVKSCSPAFFERLVVDVLVKMGYGGTRRDAGKAIGRSGDEGIDGIINEDRLGLDVIYIQAKKWEKENAIGRPEIQKFAGALMGQKAQKGIFITTSTFTKDAREYAGQIGSKIILIDGTMLAQLMIDYNVGVNLVVSYELKRLDSDYFEE